VSDDTQVAAWAGNVLAREAAPDLLINNAAVMARSAPVWELSAEEVAPVITVNVLGTIHVVRHFPPDDCQGNRRRRELQFRLG
jgi:NAD(P)-dependent dehydrogenase (short-subunit alcohol dehydrogenase family)